jgi:hypothetical protein
MIWVFSVDCTINDVDGMKRENIRFGWAMLLVFLVLLSLIALAAWYCYGHR